MTDEKSNQRKAKEAGQSAARHEKMDRKGRGPMTGGPSVGASHREKARDKRSAQDIYRSLDKKERGK